MRPDGILRSEDMTELAMRPDIAGLTGRVGHAFDGAIPIWSKERDELVRLARIGQRAEARPEPTDYEYGSEGPSFIIGWDAALQRVVGD